MTGHIRAVVRTVAAVCVLGVALLGSQPAARGQGGPQPAAAEPGAASSVTASPRLGVCQDPPCTPPPPSIHCVLRIQQYPIYLGPPLLPPPGQVVVLPEFTCTEPVPSITLSVVMLRNGSPVGSRIVRAANVDSLNPTLAVPCQDGVWKGVATGNGRFPSGYFPPEFHLHVLTWDRTLNC